MTSSRAWALVPLIALVAPSGFAQEGGVPEAKARFKDGVSLAQAGDIGPAALAFERAYAASPNYAVLYNLGQAYLALGRTVDGVHTLEKFLAEGGDKIAPDRRREVGALITGARAQLCSLEVDTSPEAEIFIDGQRLPPGPLVPQDLPAGEHLVVVRQPGHVPRVDTVILAAGQRGRLTLSLEPTPPAAERQPNPVFRLVAPPIPHVPATAVSAPDNRRSWALGLGVGGLALAGGAVGTFLWNSARYADWQRDRARIDATLARGAVDTQTIADNSRLSRRASDIQRVDDVALGLALAAGGALVSAGILWLTQERPHTVASSAPPRARPETQERAAGGEGAVGGETASR